MKANDPKISRAMSEPLGDKTASETRLAAFADEVQELRLKHHMRNVLIMTDTVFADSDGEEIVTSGSVRFGNEIDCLCLATSVRDKMIEDLNQLVNGKAKARKP